MDHLLSAESVIAVEGFFWGALNHAAMVHRLQAPLMDTLRSLCPFQSVSLSLSYFLYLPILLSDACPVCLSTFVSFLQILVKVNQRCRELVLGAGG